VRRFCYSLANSIIIEHDSIAGWDSESGRTTINNNRRRVGEVRKKSSGKVRSFLRSLARSGKTYRFSG